MTAMSMWNRAEALWALTDLGRWQEVIAETDALLSWDEERGPTPFWSGPAAYRARVLLLQGGLADALAVARLARERSLATEQPQFRLPALSVTAMALAASGQARAATAVLHEMAAFVGESDAVRRFLLGFLPDVARTAAYVGDVTVLRGLTAERPPETAARSCACHATVTGTLAEAERRFDVAGRSYAAAAERWHRLGCLEEEARAVLAARRVGAPQPEGRARRAEQALANLGIPAETLAEPWASTR
jgi:hypothetical protein